MASLRLVRARWVVPVTRPPLRDGVVAVEGDRIAWVGAADQAPPGEWQDLGNVILLPGLVNAHTHLELSHLAGLDARGGFVPWVERLVGSRAAGPETVGEAALSAIEALRTGGTVAVGDVSNTLASAPLLAGSGLEAVVFHELIGWDPQRAGQALEAAREREATLAPGVRERVAVRRAAHAPHSVSAALFASLGGAPASVHLAESPEESAFLHDGSGAWSRFLERRGVAVPFTPPGCSPVEYLDRLGALGAGTLAVHCVQVGPADCERLARRQVHVVCCPRSNRTLGVGRPPLPLLLAHGVEVALGSDSLASAASLDVLEDAALLHREFPELPPRVLLRAATTGGAEALGVGHLGALEPGRRAALAVCPGGGTADPEAALLQPGVRLRRVEPA